MPAKRNAALDAIGAKQPAPQPTASVVVFNPPAPEKDKDCARVTLYLPPKVARKFKEIAFTEDCKTHDVYLRALSAYLKSQGHGNLAKLIER